MFSRTLAGDGFGLAALLLVACQATTAEHAPRAPATPASPSAAATTGDARPSAGTPAADPIFAQRTQGWAAVDSATAARIAAFAGDYAGYLATAKTPRQAVSGLVTLFRDHGAAALAPGDRPARAPGSRYFFVSPGGDAAAFVRLGQAPLEQGARVIIATVDAPRIDLKQTPGYSSKAGFAMLDTVLHGRVDLESWLSRPLALHLHVARPGAADGGLDVIVGEAADDPILVIPDLLPHLSRKAQGQQIVDSPERMDAISARSRQAWAAFLAGQGVDERTLAQAEASLVPAGPPVFIGVDRALLSGYGHGHRSFAYAAVRALAEAETGSGAAVVVVISQTEAGGDGASGWSFVKTALSRLLAALSEKGQELDMLDTRRAYARSAALVTARLEGEAGKGVILAPRSDDAVPRATRAVLDSLDRAGAQYQVSDRGGWGPSRALSSLDMDFVDIAIPIRGRGAPMELVSTLDLFQAWLAATSWLAGS